MWDGRVVGENLNDGIYLMPPEFIRRTGRPQGDVAASTIRMV
jgi:hypothetical protein